MDEMLDAAIDGSFAEHDFSAKQLSKLESKMYRYLSNRKHRNARWKRNGKYQPPDRRHFASDPDSACKRAVVYANAAESETLGAHERELAGKTAVQAEKLSF